MVLFDRPYMTFCRSAIVGIAPFVPFLSYSTLNNIMTLKSRLLKVIGNGTIRNLQYSFLFALWSYLWLFVRYPASKNGVMWIQFLLRSNR